LDGQVIRRYHGFRLWEDWQAGMWAEDGPAGGTEESARLLSDQSLFAATAAEMLEHWPVTAEHNLTAPGKRRSWVGQASCCYLIGATEEQVREAWWLLTAEERDAANSVADDVVSGWRARYTEGASCA
jgi:hypothetical protein